MPRVKNTYILEIPHFFQDKYLLLWLLWSNLCFVNLAEWT